MSNLIVGKNSQLGFYLQDNNSSVLSLSESFCDDKLYNKIFILAAEQRTFLNLPYSDFYDVNVKKTIALVEKKIDFCQKMYIFLTSELWNNYSGPIDTNVTFNFTPSNYILSKYHLQKKIIKNFQNDERIIMVYPFNFNSTMRRSGTLFGKVFETIIDGVQNNFSNLNFKRDFSHTTYVADRIKELQFDSVIGSGQLFHMKQFVYDLCEHFEVDKSLFLLSDFQPKMNEFYDKNGKYSYEQLLKDTIEDITKVYKNKYGK